MILLRSDDNLYYGADCADGEVRLVDSKTNLYLARNEQLLTQVCQSTINESGVVYLDCREEWDVIIEGRVEICQGNAYSTVCDDRWDVLEAQVVCRQLNSIQAGKLMTTFLPLVISNF